MIQKLAFLATLFLSLSAYATSNIDLSKTSFKWEGKKVIGDDNHVGNIKLKTADLKLKKGAIESGTLVIDLNTITVTDLEGEWKEKFETHIKSEDFFEVKTHPTATLKIDKVEGSTAHGTLTIKGKSLPTVVNFVKKGNVYTGKLEVDRTKYGIIYGSKSFVKKLALDKAIADKFWITFNVAVKG